MRRLFKHKQGAAGAARGPTLVSIAVTPANPTLSAAGATQQFTATGTYSDGSTADLTSLATWASSDTSKATISAGGLATAVASGSTTISATYLGVSGNTGLTVSIFSPPANTKLQSTDVTDLANWFLHPGLTTALDTTSYDGTPNGSNTVTASAGNAQHQMYSNNATAAWTVLGGAFKAAAGLQYVSLARNDSAADYSYFDLVNGTVTDVGTAVGTIHDLGGGWYWCSVTLATSVQTFALLKFADTSAHVAPNSNWSAAGTETAKAGPFAAN